MTGVHRPLHDASDPVTEPPAAPPPRPGLLERAGAWSASHPLRVLAVWLLLLVLAVLSAGNYGSRLASQATTVDGSESARAQEVLHAAFPSLAAETDFVVLHSPTAAAQEPEFRAVAQRTIEAFDAAPGVREVTSPYRENSALISPDGHTALVGVTLDGDERDYREAVAPLQEIAGRLGTDTVEVYFTGSSPLTAAAMDRATEDLTVAESIGFPAAAIVLLLAFGSLVAAAIPLALGLTAILTSFGLLGVLAYMLEFSTISRSAVTMLAIALGIDYSLFIVTRFREELAAGGANGRLDAAAAVGRALSTAGRAVLFSGTTVVVSLAGLLLVRSPGPRNMAVAMMVAVVAMMALSMTLLPAVLGLLGRRVNSAALPWARRSLAQPDPTHSPWARLTDKVMRRPAIVAVAVTVLLGVLALPALGLRYGVDNGTGAVKDSAAGRGFTLISQAFAPGVIAPISVVVTAGSSPLSEAHLDAVAAFTERASGDARAAGVTSVTTVLDQRLGGHGTAELRTASAQAPDAVSTVVNEATDTTVVTVYPKFAPDTDEAQALVTSLRAEADRTLRPTGLDAYVGGDPALLTDVRAENSRATPLVIGSVLAASWLLLFLVFRSVVLPFKALFVNLLSVGAAFGIVVLVFQEGHGASLLGADRTGFIQVMLPLLTFAVVFGLSMDYEVFLVSRMREEWDRTGDNARAVRTGMVHTGRVITAAALIMVVVFAAFILGRMLEGKQLGFMLAVAVLLDATIVRLFLVPSLMRLIGPWNWWAPAWARAPFARRSRVYRRELISNHDDTP